MVTQISGDKKTTICKGIFLSGMVSSNTRGSPISVNHTQMISLNDDETTISTTPQPQNGDAPLVAIGGYSDALSIGIDLCRYLTAAAESGVGIGL